MPAQSSSTSEAASELDEQVPALGGAAGADKGVDDPIVTTDSNAPLAALYVKIDDWLGRLARAGRPSKLLTDAELPLTLAVAQVLLGVRSEARWLRFVPAHLPGAFPTCRAIPGTTSDYAGRYPY